MRSALRTRYYCDHCGKGSGSPSYMRRHESGCTANPQRICGMRRAAGLPQVPASELTATLQAEGFAAMCAAANNCPACILSVLRPHSDGPGVVSGPNDGRQDWNFRIAHQEWWRNLNDARQAASYDY